MRNRTLYLSILAALSSAALAQAQVSNRTAHFDIPPQPLAAALRQFAEQTGLQLAFESRLAEGHYAVAVSGNLPATEALKRLLSGTNLKFEELDQHTIAITTAAPKSRSTSHASAVDPFRVAQVSGSGQGNPKNSENSPSSKGEIQGENREGRNPDSFAEESGRKAEEVVVLLILG